MSYKKKTDANRDALFGGVAEAKDGKNSRPGGNKKKPSNSSNRDALFGDAASGATTSGAGNTTSFGSGDVSGRLAAYKKKKAAVPSKTAGGGNSSMSQEVRAQKLKQAEEYRDKANKCMQKSFFSKPDPVAASTFYKRAADAYQQLGDELHLESLYRLESANCNMQLGAWASAASDFTRAADLLIALEESGEPNNSSGINNRRQQAADYHRKAAYAWTQMNEKAKAGRSQIQAAIVLQDPEHDNSSRNMLSKDALTQMEEAVETHVPDVLNVYARYRQTGRSAFLGEDETIEKPSPETVEFAKQHLVTTAYAHEPLQDLIYLLVGFGEYASALYTAGAVSAILEADGGMSTLSLSRAYCTETILALALGDPVLAQEQFLQRHVQKTFYLQSRECKLSEDLFRAIQQRDPEALDEARDPKGSNRAAMANLHSSLQAVVQKLRTQGVARNKQSGGGGGGGGTTSSRPSNTKKSSSAAAAADAAAPSANAPKAPTSAATPSSSKDGDEDPRSLQELMGMKTGYEQEAIAAAGKDMNADDLQAELEDLDFGLDDDDNAGANSDDDDSDIDLR